MKGAFLQVACGSQVTCAIRADGTLLCFGEERRLARGLGAGVGDSGAGAGAAAAAGATAPPKDATFVELSAPSRGIGMCGVTASRPPQVRCWGEVAELARVPADLEPAVLGALNFDL